MKETLGADPKSNANPNMFLSRCAWFKRLIEESIMRGIHEATFCICTDVFGCLPLRMHPRRSGQPPPKPGQSPFKDCATDCPEMVVIPAGRSLAKECGVGTGTVQRIAREMAEVSRPLAGGGAAA